MRTSARFLPFISLLLLTLVCQGDNIYQQRLASIQSTIPLPYNDLVRAQIDALLNQNQEQNNKMLGLGLLFFPQAEAALAQTGSPQELKYLMPSQSGMDNLKTNAFGAGGYFQFLYQNARLYHLKINSYVDERRDAKKSAWSAGKYFQELHAIYNDWLLSIAAFASTPANVNKAIVMAGGSMDYWAVHPFLPMETRDAVPRFIATVYLFHFYNEHHLTPWKGYPSLEADTVEAQQMVSFDQIALVLNIPRSTIEWLNPIFKMGVVPFSENHYSLLLPKGMGPLFKQKQWQIYSTIISKPNDDSPTISQDNSPPEQQPPVLSKVTYRVKSGDNIVTIADCFDCTVMQLKSWNHLRNNALPVGKWLTFWVPTEKVATYQVINSMGPKQKQNLARKD